MITKKEYARRIAAYLNTEHGRDYWRDCLRMKFTELSEWMDRDDAANAAAVYAYRAIEDDAQCGGIDSFMYEPEILKLRPPMFTLTEKQLTNKIYRLARI